MDKLSLSTGQVGEVRGEEDVGAEGARGESTGPCPWPSSSSHSSSNELDSDERESKVDADQDAWVLLDSVNFLNLGNEDEGFVPAGARESNKVSPILPCLIRLVRHGPGTDHASHRMSTPAGFEAFDLVRRARSRSPGSDQPAIPSSSL